MSEGYADGRFQVIGAFTCAQAGITASAIATAVANAENRDLVMARGAHAKMADVKPAAGK